MLSKSAISGLNMVTSEVLYASDDFFAAVLWGEQCVPAGTCFPEWFQNHITYWGGGVRKRTNVG